MITIVYYYSQGNEECARLDENLAQMHTDVDFQLVRIDVDSDDTINKVYGQYVPVLEIGPYLLQDPIKIDQVAVTLRAAQDRMARLNQIDRKGYKKRVENAHSLTGADRFSYWFSKYYMPVFITLLVVYTGLPFLAPVLFKVGATAPAKAIYLIYRPLCHQLAFRSYFLFGEQPFYPRALAGVNGYETYEEAMGSSVIDVLQVENYIGNEVMGYKVALCQRDIAIYGSLLLFALIFHLSGRKIHHLPWYVWIIVGLIPIGIDGTSQLPGLLVNVVPSWVPIRESTPFLRTLTGILFGITTSWYMFPLIEEAMRETRVILARKMAVIQQTGRRP